MLNERATELGRLLGQSPEYQAVKRASDALNQDTEAVALLEQMERALLDIYQLPQDPREIAMREATAGIEEVQRTQHPVELSPQNAYIRRLQHQLAGNSGVTSSSRGRDPHRRVRLEPQGRSSSTPRRRR